MAEAGKTRLLVIDDDRKLCRLIRDYLEPMGYEVELAHTGPDGLEKAQAGRHQVVILDVMLPGMDGFEVLKQLRRTSDIPVLMLTSRGEEADRIVGLEIGADDYLPKTFSTRELLARLRAVTRRATRAVAGAPPESEPEIVVGRLRVNPAARVALLDDQPLHAHAGRVGSAGGPGPCAGPGQVARAIAGGNPGPELRRVRPLD